MYRILWIVLACAACILHAATLQSTRSHQTCGASDPEIPRFSMGICPSSHSYTRLTVSVDVGAVGTANVSFVGTSSNRTRPGAESMTCEGPFCVPVPNTKITWSFVGARAQWSLAPLGYAIPYSYTLLNITTDANASECLYTHVPDQLCVNTSTCIVGTPEECTSDTDCAPYAYAPPPIDDGSGLCPIGTPLCYTLCCPIVNTTDAVVYQVATSTPLCRLYQPIGPPFFAATINVRVQNSAYNRVVNISGGIGERVYGFQNDLRGFMRLTIANPSTFNVPQTIGQGYVAICDSGDGEVYDSTTTLSDPPGCGDDLGDRWFYIPPGKTGVYGLGARQYGESAFDVLQDIVTSGCVNATDAIPGLRPNTNPNDPTSDYESPSPCTVLGMIDSGDPRSMYWLPPQYDTRDWRIQEGIMSVDLHVGGRVVPDAFTVDVDIPTLIMPYAADISPGYVDVPLSRCFTNGVNAGDPDLIPGFLSPIVCNPPVGTGATAQDQTYTLTYSCDPAVHLARTSDTVVVRNNQCVSTNVAYNISLDDINGADRVCNINLSPALSDPYAVLCQFGAVVSTASPHCSLWEFGCNFGGENGGAWYRCIPFWIILAATLTGIGLIVWLAVSHSQKKEQEQRIKADLRTLNDGVSRIREVE